MRRFRGVMKSASPGLGPDIPVPEAIDGRDPWEPAVSAGGSRVSPRPEPRPRFRARPTSRLTQGRSRGGASSRTGALRPEPQDAPALQRLRSPAEGGRPLLARPGRRSRGISPPRAGVQATPPRGVPRELETEGAAAARWPLALSWKGTARRGSAELGAAFVLITAPSPQPQTAPAYSGHSINAY